MSVDLFKRLNLPIVNPPLCAMSGDEVFENVDTFDTFSPIDGAKIASFSMANAKTLSRVTQKSDEAFEIWRDIPAPKRGELVKRIGELVRENKKALASLITLEVGKSEQEALGEVQEWSDICDFAVGLSRQLYGLTMATEREDHRLMETWHPLGVVGVISAFNFPMAVWAWNAMIAFVCGDSVVVKPSNKAPLCAKIAPPALDLTAFSRRKELFAVNLPSEINIAPPSSLARLLFIELLTSDISDPKVITTAPPKIKA